MTTNDQAVRFYRQVREAIGAGNWHVHTEFHAAPRHNRGNTVTATLLLGARDVIRQLRNDAALDHMPVIIDFLNPTGPVVAVTLTAHHFALGTTPQPYSPFVPAAELLSAQVSLHGVPSYWRCVDGHRENPYTIQEELAYADTIITPAVIVAELESLGHEYLSAAHARPAAGDRLVLGTSPAHPIH